MSSMTRWTDISHIAMVSKIDMTHIQYHRWPNYGIKRVVHLIGKVITANNFALLNQI